MTTHHQILIVGAGNAGVSVAAQLLRADSKLKIGIIDPSETHYYQPAWTLVGGGVFNVNKTARPQASVIPTGAKWIKESVQTFDPGNNTLTTNAGQYSYDYLVVCPGIQLDWNKIKGLPEALGKNGVTSNYSFQTAPYTFECLKNFKGGNAIFTDPGTPVKCGGAPHKIMYMAGDYLRMNGLLPKSNLQYFTARGFLFAVPEYNKTLLEVVDRIGAKLNFFHDLVEIRADEKIAIFNTKNEAGEPVLKEQPYEFIHVCPPQSAPDFIKSSPLAMKGDPLGWVDVNKDTLRHNTYRNVYSLGDASSLPTSKTGAAIRKQAPVVVANLLDDIRNKAPQGVYDGYTACPLVTGYGKLVMAEFDYDKKPAMSFPIDQTKEQWSMYQVKRRLLPWMYWNMILKGKA